MLEEGPLDLEGDEHAGDGSLEEKELFRVLCSGGSPLDGGKIVLQGLDGSRLVLSKVRGFDRLEETLGVMYSIFFDKRDG